MIWHVLLYVAGFLAGGLIGDIFRAYVRGAARRRPALPETEEAKWTRRLAELAPYMEAAEREVDALLPGTPPIAIARPSTQRQLAPVPTPLAEWEPRGEWSDLSNADLVSAYWKARRDDESALPPIRRELERRYGKLAIWRVDTRMVP